MFLDHFDVLMLKLIFLKCFDVFSSKKYFEKQLQLHS